MKPNWFVAYPVAPTGWFATLIQTAPDNMRRFPADDLHLTLAFFGGVDEADARRGWAQALRDPPEALRVRFGPVEPFGNPRKPSAFGLTLSQGREAACEVLKHRGDAILLAAGCKPARRPPRPHVTLARPPYKARQADRQAALRWSERAATPEVEVALDTLALYTWAHDRRQRLFRVVESRPLT